MVHDLRKRTVTPAIHPMPPMLLALGERMRRSLPLIAHFTPNEANAIGKLKEQEQGGMC